MPLVIKPVRDGSSLGLTIARSEEQVKEGIEHALKNDHKVMVERYIEGREITVSVIGNDDPVAMPVIEIILQLIETILQLIETIQKVGMSNLP